LLSAEKVRLHFSSVEASQPHHHDLFF